MRRYQWKWNQNVSIRPPRVSYSKQSVHPNVCHLFNSWNYKKRRNWSADDPTYLTETRTQNVVRGSWLFDECSLYFYSVETMTVRNIGFTEYFLNNWGEHVSLSKRTTSFSLHVQMVDLLFLSLDGSYFWHNKTQVLLCTEGYNSTWIWAETTKHRTEWIPYLFLFLNVFFFYQGRAGWWRDRIMSQLSLQS